MSLASSALDEEVPQRLVRLANGQKGKGRGRKRKGKGKDKSKDKIIDADVEEVD